MKRTTAMVVSRSKIVMKKMATLMGSEEILFSEEAVVAEMVSGAYSKSQPFSVVERVE